MMTSAIHKLKQLKIQLNQAEDGNLKINQGAFYNLLINAILDLVPAGFPEEVEEIVPEINLAPRDPTPAPKKRGRKPKAPAIQ
jgi:hypothetical protein